MQALVEGGKFCAEKDLKRFVRRSLTMILCNSMPQ